MAERLCMEEATGKRLHTLKNKAFGLTHYTTKCTFGPPDETQVDFSKCQFDRKPLTNAVKLG